uniref:Uncharacterized protein n=1 Tax=Octopus bimaculoides TaxID=37653 RepID=A0A0L8FL29_OCTBM
MKNATEAVVELVTREWLLTASDRNGGQKRKEKKNLDKSLLDNESATDLESAQIEN